MDLAAVLGFLIIALLHKSQASHFQFFFENEIMFDKCPDVPDNNGIHDLCDISEYQIEFIDGSIIVQGNATVVWDVQPEDRIELRCEVFKYQRGAWQPTVFSLISNDFCADQFDKDSYWHQLWTKHIPAEERKCLNNNGLTYHMPLFDISPVFDVQVNIEGRHKVVTTLTAYENGVNKRPNGICFQFIGEFIKI